MANFVDYNNAHDIISAMSDELDKCGRYLNSSMTLAEIVGDSPSGTVKVGKIRLTIFTDTMNGGTNPDITIGRAEATLFSAVKIGDGTDAISADGAMVYARFKGGPAAASRYLEFTDCTLWWSTIAGGALYITIRANGLKPYSAIAGNTLVNVDGTEYQCVGSPVSFNNLSFEAIADDFLIGLTWDKNNAYFSNSNIQVLCPNNIAVKFVIETCLRCANLKANSVSGKSDVAYIVFPYNGLQRYATIYSDFGSDKLLTTGLTFTNIRTNSEP